MRMYTSVDYQELAIITEEVIINSSFAASLCAGSRGNSSFGCPTRSRVFVRPMTPMVVGGVTSTVGGDGDDVDE